MVTASHTHASYSAHPTFASIWQARCANNSSALRTYIVVAMQICCAALPSPTTELRSHVHEQAHGEASSSRRSRNACSRCPLINDLALPRKCQYRNRADRLAGRTGGSTGGLQSHHRCDMRSCTVHCGSQTGWTQSARRWSHLQNTVGSADARWRVDAC